MENQQNVSGAAELATWAPLRQTVRCVECGRAWLVRTERWRMYLIDVGDDMPSLTFPFCPGCAMRLIGEL
jgi:hypothetical protein